MTQAVDEIETDSAAAIQMKKILNVIGDRSFMMNRHEKMLSAGTT